MKLLDLFSGIGGFSLAASWCGIETVAFCEIDSFCQKVLNKNFPGVEIYSDIKKLKFVGAPVETEGDKWSDYYQPTNIIYEDRDYEVGSIDIITGGFPCQPFSVAGKRKGKEDDRYLWPEMLRVISEVKPSWVVGENVAGIIDMELDKVCSDLEAEGYEVQPFIIPACAVNAPHRRDRVWIIANRSGFGLHKGKSENNRPRENGNADRFTEILNEGNATNSEGVRYGGRRIYGNGKHRKQSLCKDIENNGNEIWSETSTSDNQLKQVTSNGNGKHGKEFERRYKLGCTGREITLRRSIHETDWDRNWFEVATEFCGMDARVPDRIHRIKALGNSIVPQVAYEILKSIQEI